MIVFKILANKWNDFDLMETFLELLILKKEGRLHFPLSAIVFEILISQKLQFDPYVLFLAMAAMLFHRRIYNSQTIVYTLYGFSYQVWLNYVQWFSRRISKCKKLTDGRRDDERNVVAKAHPDF